MTHDAGHACCAAYGLMMAQIENLKSDVKRLKAQRDNALLDMEKYMIALRPFADIALEQDDNKLALDMISGPDLCITPNDVRAARVALGERS